MLELLRKSEGEISRQEFGKGIALVAALTLLAGGLFYWLSTVNSSMDWQTTAIAPFLALIGAFVGFSILYFWTCLFLKRFRAKKLLLWPIYLWLGIFFLAPILQLVAYQFTSLEIPDGGFLKVSEILIWILRNLFLVVTLILLFLGFKKATSKT